MKPFLFIIDAKPQPGNQPDDNFGGAIVNIWVFDEFEELARAKAFRYINFHGWNVVKVECTLHPNPKHIAALDEFAALNYRKAELDGISAHFNFWQKEPSPVV